MARGRLGLGVTREDSFPLKSGSGSASMIHEDYNRATRRDQRKMARFSKPWAACRTPGYKAQRRRSSSPGASSMLRRSAIVTTLFALLAGGLAAKDDYKL